MRIRALSIITAVFAVIWACLIALDYGNKHPGYFFAFKYFRFFSLYAFLGLIGVLCLLLKNQLFKNEKGIKFRPLYLVGLVLLLFFMIIFSYSSFGLSPSTFGHVMHYLMYSLKTALILLGFVILFKTVGSKISSLFFKTESKKSITVDIALGIIVFITFMFFLGLFGWLNSYSILGLVVAFTAIGFSKLKTTGLNLFWNPIDLRSYSALGILSFLFIVFFLSLNFLSVQIPFPGGFDSRNVYMNISKLIALDGQLVSGYQPYNWSLFMSIGYMFNDYAELSLSLAFLPVVLVAIGVYEIGIRFLNIEKNWLLFLIALVIVTPALVNQMFVELKVDFAMLLMQVAALITFFTWLPSKERSPNIDTTRLLILLGLLMGFGMGIKLINLFLVFVLLALIWWNHHYSGLLGIVLLSLSILMFAGIDELSGLQVYHLGHKSVALVSAIIGLLLLGYNFVKERPRFIKSLVFSLAYGLSILLMFSPWMGKNYADTRSLSPNAILMGKSNKKEGRSALEIIRKYNTYKASSNKTNE